MNSAQNVLFFTYLFLYIQVAPAFEQPSLKHSDFSSAVEQSETDITLHESVPKLVRHRRFFGAIIAIVTGLISGIGAAVIGDQINKAIERNTGSVPPPEQKPIIINNIINNNPPVAYALKQSVSRINRQAGNALKVSSSGYNCNSNFCRRYGDGPSSIGLCSPDICHCSNGQPIVQQCGTGTVFDPLYKVCNWPYNLKVCGN